MPEIPDAVILSGGLGLRLRGVIGDTPKPMAQIGCRPFLELLLKQLKRRGFSRVILSVGYKQELIRQHFGRSAYGLELIYSIETSALGTGGALRQAFPHLNTNDVLIMNGDSYTDADLSLLVRVHRENHAHGTVVVIPDTRSDAGSVVLDSNGKVTTFSEKRVVLGSRYLSAGIYILKKELVPTIPPVERVSLEEQLFPQWLNAGKAIAGFVFEGQCLDIGTPERYEKAQGVLQSVELQGIPESEGQP